MCSLIVKQFLLIFSIIDFRRVEATVVSKGKDGWSHQIDLEKDEGIKIMWKHTPADKDGNKWIVMEMQGKTKGYVGVGFSPNGAMTGADMVIGWVDNSGKSYLQDYYGIGNEMPIEDPIQDYQLISAEEKDGWTKIQFKRKWDTCDQNNDMPLRNDTMRLIWAFGDDDPVLRTSTGKYAMLWHGIRGRGDQSVFLVDDAFAAPFPDEEPESSPKVKIWDMIMDNNTIDGERTTYFCKIVKFPSLEKKHHMIGWKPILAPETKEHIHHMVFYECMIPPEHGGTESVFEAHTNHSSEKCYTKNMPPEWTRHCVTFLFVWVAGSEGEMMPEHVGSPLGEQHGGATYFMMEIHYDNPNSETFVDHSGVRIFYTDKLRPNDGSVVLMGYRITPFQLLPPKQSNFITHGICSSECTAMIIPPGGIRIINTLLHAHLSAKKLRLRHFRNGTELPPVAEDNYYDFNYQQSRALKNEITIFPGDELIVECEYNSMNNNRVVLGGLATTQETCQAFLVYYPRIGLMQCTSQVEFNDFFKGLGIDKVEGKVLSSLKMPYDPKGTEFDPPDNSKTLEETGDGESFQSVFDHMNITFPKRFKGMTVGNYLKDANWSDNKFSKSVEQYWKKGKHYAYCTGHGRKRHPLKKHIIPYPTIKKPLIKKQSKVCPKPK